MPSSLIFVGLVVLWLLILVPAVARRQQEVARLSPALLSGRVLERPMRHRLPEVGVMERLEDRRATTVGELVERRDDVPSPRDRERDRRGRRDDAAGRDGTAPDDDVDHDDLHDARDGDPDGEALLDEDDDAHLDEDDYDDEPRHASDEYDDEDDRLWERPPARYRPGRGGYDPEAAAVAAHAKYAFRQRVVLGMLVLVLASAVPALLVATPFWILTGVLGSALAGYLTYLRRQVRIEEAIRARRSARLAGTRRPPAADDPDLDGWARRGREAGRSEEASDLDDADDETLLDEDDADADEREDTAEVAEHAVPGDDEDWTADDGEPARIRGTGEPLGVLPARRRTVDGTSGEEPESTLPRLKSAPPPPIPAGTSLVDVDDEDELDAAVSPIDHRRAAGE